MAEDFDGNEIQDETSFENGGGEKIVTKARLPRGREVIGLIDTRLGGNKMMVTCLDGISRNSRVPGRLKRKLWIREGDVLLIEPWEYDNEKGDVIFKYQQNQVAWLKKKGYIKDLENLEEF